MRKRNGTRRTSIVDSFHEPALPSQVPVNAVERRFFLALLATFRLNFRTQRSHLDVPLVARPGAFGPPVAFCSPRPSERKDLPAHTFATEECRLSVLKVYRRRKRRPVN